MYERLFKYIREERVVLFIGAGFSLKAGAPSGSSIVDAIISSMTEEERNSLSGMQLDYVAKKFVDMRNGSRNELYQILESQLSFVRSNLEDHKLLAQIPYFRYIFTTNYDTLLEENIPNSKVYVDDSECAYYDNNYVSIFKLHGDLRHRDNIVISSTDYYNLISDNKNCGMWSIFKSLSLTKNILFVGYSLEDQNVLRILQAIKSKIGSDSREHFLVAPNMRQHDIAKLYCNGVTYIDSDANTLLLKLIKDIEDSAISDFRKKKTSFDIIGKVCDYHNLEISATSLPDTNRVDSIMPKQGCQSTAQIKFSFKSNKDLFADDVVDFAKYGEYNEEVDGPAIVIPKSDIQSFDARLNGLRTIDGVSELILGAPEVKKGKATVTIGDSFCQELPYRVLNLNRDTRRIIIKTPIFRYEIDAQINTEKDSIKFNAIPYFAESVKNITMAKYWINALLLIGKGETITISTDMNTQKFSSNQKNTAVAFFNNALQYFKLVEEIERITRKKFSFYDFYSDDRYVKASVILSYLKQQPVWRNFDGYTIEGDIDGPIEGENGPFVVVRSEKLDPILFNGKQFNLGYQSIILQCCEVQEMTYNSRGSEHPIHVKFIDKAKRFLFYYADRPAIIRGNELILPYGK